MTGIHPRLRIARTLVQCANAERAVNEMFEKVYECCAELEVLGVHGLADLLDAAAEKLRDELAVIATAAKSERGLPTAAPALPGHA